MDLLGLPGFIAAIVYFVMLGVKLFAFINSLLWSTEHYRAADKWTKQGWVILLGVAAFVQVIWPGGGIINLALTIAALVYLADVRPAMASLRRR